MKPLKIIDTLETYQCLTPHDVAITFDLMEVMVAGTSTSSGRGKAAVDVVEPPTGPTDPLHATFAGLATSIGTTPNTTTARAELEEARKQLLVEGTALAIVKRPIEAVQR